ncbi:WG repeat-containing protein [Sporosarcina cascadiensis]|uniref:WG repeat-containing protein n=1 Tax=Sporosarcina cascadiensis TaxID=2660747 RepID=UPI00129A3D3A|nr:WG repeat-containing protein [Sporosarcina cascadiensis]
MGKLFSKLSIIFSAILLFAVLVPFNVLAETHSETGQYFYTETISPLYDDAKTFSEGLAAVGKNGKWGYINEAGETVIDFQYDRAHSFSEGKAIVEKHVGDGDYVQRFYYIITPDNNTTSVKYGESDFYTLNGYFKEYGGPLDEMYDTVFYNGYVMLPADSPTGTFIFDKYGEAYDAASYLPTEGTLAKYDHYSDINSEEYEMLYDEIEFIGAAPFNQGMAPVAFTDPNNKNNHYWTFLTKDRTLWSGPKFYYFFVKDPFGSYQVFNDNSLASIMNAEGKFGAVNMEGKTVIPFQYEQLRVFNEGVAGFLQNNKFGFIDINGNEVIKPQFDDVSLFENGLAVVRQGSMAYVIDKKGNKIKGSENIPPSSYFFESKSDGNNEIGNMTVSPGKYILTTSHEKFGFAKINSGGEVINVTGISLNNPKLEMEIGKTAALAATVSPVDATNKKVIWSSSNEEVATVDASGNVAAKSKGKANITVTTEDGEYTAVSEVTVKESSTVTDPYEGYKVWDTSLKNNSASHSWRIKLNMNVNESTVDSRSVFILDKNYKKINFVNPRVENIGNNGYITLDNNGSFIRGEEYWIIIEDTIQSFSGKKLVKGLKAKFEITK